jgi:hypothetical protein
MHMVKAMLICILYSRNGRKDRFWKGTYYASKGFCNGRIRYLPKEKLEKSSISIEAGQFNTLRTVGLFNLQKKAKCLYSNGIYSDRWSF